MNSGKSLSRHLLSNGLTLEIWDRSRPVAGDRWLVVLEGTVKVPVNDTTLPLELKPRAAEVIAALGPQLVYSQKDERNFIAAQDVAGLLAEMAARLLELADGYLGHPEFPGRLIRKKFAACQQQPRWSAS